VCQAIRDLPVPVIGRINGFALGGGMEVAADCDMRIVARSARFGMPEVRLGIPSVIEAALLPGLIGFGRARRLVLLGDVVGAEEIADWGFCDELVDDADLDAMVERYLSALLECGPNALRLQKELVRRWEDLPLSQAVAAGIETFGRAFKSDEPRRLMNAFQARRKARRG
jgi:enoyl-CoA hydratase/carnithine racemase